MKIPLNININIFYRVLLAMMDKFPPIKGLMNREMDVLAELMYQNYQNKNIEDVNKRQIILFSTDSRKIMQGRLSMNEGSYNDYLSRLRRKKVITKDNKLLPFLNIIPGDKYEFLVKFNINE